MPLFSFFSGLRPGPRQGLCPWTPRGAASPLPQFAKVVARRRQGGFLQLPCSLGFRLASSATGGARLRPSPAFEKSGGKPGGKLLWLSNGLCRPAAHRERRARFAGREPGRAGGGLFASPAEIPAARGGGGVQGPGPLALAPEQARCRAQPGSGRVGVAHPPPPPRPLEFPPTPKRQRKSQAPRSMGPGCLNDPRKGQGNGPAPLGKARAHALRARAA